MARSREQLDDYVDDLERAFEAEIKSVEE